MAAPILGRWRGGPNGNIIMIERGDNGRLVGKFRSKSTSDDPAMAFGFLHGFELDKGRTFRGWWINPPNMKAKENVFRIQLSGDGQSWEGTWRSGEDTGTWSAVRAPRRAKGRLPTEGWSKNKEVFDRLMERKDIDKWAEAQRGDMLGESVRRFEDPRAGATLGEGPFVGVGAPYDERALARAMRSSRHGGRQFAAGNTRSSIRRDSREQYVSSPWEDSGAVARRLRKDAEARVIRPKDAANRPPFRPSSARGGVPGQRDVFLGVVDAEAVPATLREEARRQRESEARRHRARAHKDDDGAGKGGATTAPAPFYSSVSRWRSPLEREPVRGLLVANTGALDHAPAAPAAATAPAAAHHDDDGRGDGAAGGPGGALAERPPFRPGGRRSVLEQEPYRGLIIPAEEAERELAARSHAKAAAGSSGKSRPVSAPQGRSRAQSARHAGDAASAASPPRPPFRPSSGFHRLQAWEALPEHLPDPIPERVYKRKGDKNERAAVFRPASAKLPSRLTRPIAMSNSALRRLERHSGGY